MASWAGYWALITFIAIFTPIDYKYSPKAILMISLFVFAFVVGGIPFKYGVLQKKSLLIDNPPLLSLKRLVYAKTIFGIAMICAIVVCLLYLYSVGFSLNTILLQLSIISTAPYEISYMRYYNYNPYSFWINLFSIPIYTSAFLAGFLFSNPGHLTYKIKYLLVPLVAAGLITIVTTAKMNFLMTVFFFLGSYATSLIIYQNHIQTKIQKNEIIFFSLLGVATVVIFFSSLFLRYKSDVSNFEIIIARFFDAFSGFLAGFSAWVEMYVDGVHENIDYWGFTFQWIRHIFDTGDRLQGLFPSIVEYQGYGSPSNIFTLYRCMIEDFTMPGTLILLCFSSYLFSSAYCNLLAGSLKIVHWGSMLFYYPSLFYSFVFLVFGYSTAMSAWLLACLLIKLIFL